MTVVYLVAGPNGAGKTTLYEKILRPMTGFPFVNADEIARALAGGGLITDDISVEAARLAASRRESMIESGTSFVAETVFSHPSKVEFVRSTVAAGCRVRLRVVVVPEDLSVGRVAARVVNGGHDVPEDRIRARHQRLWSLVAEAIALAENTIVYDNSRRDDPFRIIARYAAGVAAEGPLRPWPAWAPSEIRPEGV